MPKETEQIDRLFLELSQFTSATTAKEIKLARVLKALMVECPKTMQESEAWDQAVMVIDCMPKHIFK
jgi:hypothetical protein